MDENNEEVDKLKEGAKDTAKGVGKFLLNKFKKWIIIGVLCLFGLLLIVGLLHLVEYSVKNIFTNIINSFNIGSVEDAAQTTSDVNDSIVYVDNGGHYKLKANYAKEILDELERQKVNGNVMGFNLEDENEREAFENMIGKYIKAEVATTFPNTGQSLWDTLFNKDDAEGNIFIKRTSISNGTTIDLEYVKYSTFCSWIDNNNQAQALKHFSINPNNFKLCIARKETMTQYYNIDKYGQESLVETVGGALAKEELSYRDQLENYAVPLNFLITMHLVTQDSDSTQDEAFMEELVKMATGAGVDEPIVLTYVDSQQEYETIYKYEGQSKEVVNEFIDREDDNFYYSSANQSLSENEVKTLDEGEVYKTRNIHNDNVHTYYGDAVLYEKQITTSYSGKLYITKTDTWIKDTKRNVNQLPNDVIPSAAIQNNIQVDPIWRDYTILGKDEDTLETIATKLMKTVENITYLTETETSKSTTREFSVVDSKSEIIVDEFIELIRKYPSVENKIATAPSNIFYLLQQNSNTQKLEKIMRYVLYELNDVDYGVKLSDLDFLLEDETFITASGGIYSGGTVEETIWFTMLSKNYSKPSIAAVLGNLQIESGFRTNNLENKFEIGGIHSIGHTDKSYTEAVNNGLKGITEGNTYTREKFISDHYIENCGAGYGLLQWTWHTYKGDLWDFAKNSGGNIDDIEVQLEFLLSQLDGLSETSEWRTSEDPKRAAEVLCKGFINPGASASNVETRANASQKYYDEFKDKTVGTFEASGGGGTLYSGTYTSTRGRTFTILNQNTIPGWGAKCNRAAAAIIASGYTDQDASTLINTLNTKYAQAGDTIVPRDNFFNLYGLEVGPEYGGMGVGNYSETLRNQLSSGGYAMIWLNMGEYYGKSGTRWTGQIHWVAILDYKKEGGNEKILIADWRGAGWYDIDEFKHGISKISLINEM